MFKVADPCSGALGCVLKWIIEIEYSHEKKKNFYDGLHTIFFMIHKTSKTFWQKDQKRGKYHVSHINSDILICSLRAGGITRLHHSPFCCLWSKGKNSQIQLGAKLWKRKNSPTMKTETLEFIIYYYL